MTIVSLAMQSTALLIISLLTINFSFAQTGYLFVKKGHKKVLSLTIGDDIHVKTKRGTFHKGTITAFINDTVVINGRMVDSKTIHHVIFKERPKKKFPDTKTLMLIGAGSALTTAGLTLSKQQKLGDAAVTGMVIGFGPLLIKHFGGRLLRAIFRKKYVIGGRFRIQILDLSIPGIRMK